jgi:hypothetical protein
VIHAVYLLQISQTTIEKTDTNHGPATQRWESKGKGNPTFNVLFRNKEHWFVGEKGAKEE